MRASLNSTILFSGTQTSKPLRVLTRSIRYVLYAPLRKKRRQPKEIVDGEGRTESEEWLVVSHAIHHRERERERGYCLLRTHPPVTRTLDFPVFFSVREIWQAACSVKVLSKSSTVRSLDAPRSGKTVLTTNSYPSDFGPTWS